MIDSAPEGRSVLVVDDDENVACMLQGELERHGYVVTVVCDPREALALLEREDFDRVLLDVMMPYVDGWQILSWIRKHPTKRQAWVALMTAQAHAGLDDTAWPVRADRYVAKPIDVETLFPLG